MLIKFEENIYEFMQPIPSTKPSLYNRKQFTPKLHVDLINIFLVWLKLRYVFFLFVFSVSFVQTKCGTL